MLERFLKLKDPITATYSLLHLSMDITIIEWEIIEEAMSCLLPFFEITQEICGEKNVTLSKVLFLTSAIQKFLEGKTSKNDAISQMLRTLKNECNKRFREMEANPLYTDCAILDPRFKRKSFKSDFLYQKALSSLRSRIASIALPAVAEEAVQIESVRSEDTETRTFSIWNQFDEEFSKTAEPENNTAAAIRELDKYIKEEYVNRKCDPLEWWRERKCLYPRVFQYVLKRLCIPATSVPCERIFSAAGLIVNDRRSLLKPEKVSKLVFLHHNL